MAGAFRTTWDPVVGAVEMAVAWGRQPQDLTGITALGLDERQWRRGHQYLTLVYQLDPGAKRRLGLGDHRQVKTLLRFFRWWGLERSAARRFSCRDMGQPSLRVIAKKAGPAIPILDRFHSRSHLSTAIDEIRAREARVLKAEGRAPLLTHTRWLWLKRPEPLTAPQAGRLAELLRDNLKAVRAYLLKEDFQFFWQYVSPHWAGGFLDRWCTRTLRSRLEPMPKVARLLRAHRPLLLHWFRAQGALSSGAVEGFNNQARLTTRRAYGFRTFRAIEVALYHTLGALPEPETTHRFCSAGPII